MTRPRRLCEPLILFLPLFGCLIPVGHAQVIMMAGGMPVSGGPVQPQANLLVVDEAVQNAVTDFQRHSERKDWTKAFRALDNLPNEKRVGMFPGEPGFLTPARQRIWKMMVDIPAEGREAFRLFYDPKAKQLYEQLMGQIEKFDPQALTTADTIYNVYFLSTYGDDAANLLGDAAFERGDFASAIGYFRAILDYHPESNLSSAKSSAKLALALAADERPLEAEASLDLMRRRFEGAKISIAGQTEVSAEEFVANVLKTIPRPANEIVANEKDIELAESFMSPQWQMRFLTKKGIEQLQNATNSHYYMRESIETYVPPIASDQDTIYVNWLGCVFAMNSETGKLLWRNESFDKPPPQFQTLMQRGSLAGYSIRVEGDLLLTTFIPIDQLNNWPPTSRLIAFDKKTGAKKWTANEQLSYTSRPIPWQDGLLVVGLKAQQQPPQATIEFLDKETGASRWSMDLGQIISAKYNPYYGGMSLPSCELTPFGRDVILMTNSGSCLRISPSERAVGLQYKLYEQTNTEGGMFFFYNMPTPEEKLLHLSGRAIASEGNVFLKEVGKADLLCMDLAQGKIIWKHPTVSAGMLLGVDEDFVYLGNSELSAYDRKDGKLRWSLRVPIFGGGLRLIRSKGSVFLASQRGLIEIDRATGVRKRLVRHADSESSGVSMSVFQDRLITVSNRAVTAYSLSAPSTQTVTQASGNEANQSGGAIANPSSN